jgi:hypothetical protein
VGRFVSEDPACNGLNWFIYVNDNPSNLVDRNGREGEGGGGSLALWGFIDVLISIAEQGFCGWHPPAGLEHLASFIINSLAARNYVKYAFDQLVNIGKAFSAGAAGEEEKATQYFIGDSLVAGAFAIMAVVQLVQLAMICEMDKSTN